MKSLFICQGASGSGKSTVARALKTAFEAEGKTVSIRSTDDLFMVEGVYQFNPAKLGFNHNKNQGLVEDDMVAEVNCICVDNTNIKNRDALPYIKLAEKHGYTVTVIRVDAGLEEAKRRNATRTADRKIPEEAIERQYNGMEQIRLEKNSGQQQSTGSDRH